MNQVFAYHRIKRQTRGFDCPRIIRIALNIIKVIVFNDIVSINRLLLVRPAANVNTVSPSCFGQIVM